MGKEYAYILKLEGLFRGELFRKGKSVCIAVHGMDGSQSSQFGQDILIPNITRVNYCFNVLE
jgi:hypothetical protein